MSEVEPGRIASTPIYKGRIVELSLDKVRFPDGSTGELEMIRHRGAAAVLPVLSDPEGEDPIVVLVRQYRYASGGYLYEVPAGLRASPDEAWDDCALRELEEETGLRAATLKRLTSIYTTPGFTDEQIHLYLATELSEGSHRRDADEFMDVVQMPLSEALQKVRSGEIQDAKSICTLLYTAGFELGL